ncbi:hypothetical protein [Roseateles sp. P5_E11]
MSVPLRAIAALAVLALAGCANYKAITNFAGETTKMTGAVRQEIQQVAKLCNDAADVRVLLSESTPTGDVEGAKALKKSCGLTGDATVAFQEVTVDTLELYAKTLLAMVDDKQFEVRSSIQGTAKKLSALKDKDGASIVNPKKVTAVASVLSLLADVLVKAEREDGIRRLVAAGPDLVANARVLRSFFVDEAQQSNYDGWLTTTARVTRGSEISVGMGKPMAVAEPIRTAELRRQIGVTSKAIDSRLAKAGKAGDVPTKIVAAIDAWIVSVPVFQQEALKSDPRALLNQLDDFRTKTLEARDAIEAGF